MSIYVQRRGKAHSSTISLQGMQHRLAAGMIRSASFPRDTTTQDSKVRWWKPTTRLSTSSDVPFFLSPTCQWNRNDLTNPNYTSLLTYVHFPTLQTPPLTSLTKFQAFSTIAPVMQYPQFLDPLLTHTTRGCSSLCATCVSTHNSEAHCPRNVNRIHVIVFDNTSS